MVPSARGASAPERPPFAHMYACRVTEALRLFDEMLARGVRPNTVAISTLIHGCLEHADNATAANAAAEAVRAHSRAIDDPSLALAADAALIAGYCRQPARRSWLREALRLFADYTTLAQRGPGTRVAPRPIVDVRTCNALMLALTTAGELPSARRILAAMDARVAAAPNAFSYAILMHAHGARRQFGPASELWERLQREGLVDTVALNAWLATCMACGEVSRALQAFQHAKVSWSHVQLDRVTFASLIDGLCVPRHRRSTRQGARRALQLWAEMRDRGLFPDRGIVAALFSACHEHLEIDVALRLRGELISLGWSERALREHSATLLQRLPPMRDVLAEPRRWAALGVFPAADIATEACRLQLQAPVRPGDEGGNGAADPAAAQQQLLRPRGAAAAAAAAAAVAGEEDEASDAEATARPASPSQEIFERKGWNDFDGSGWRPW